MVTAVAHPNRPAKPMTGVPGRRFDHIFFSGMALLMLVTVFIGFAPTYYLAGVFHAPLPNLLIQVHGAAFSCWILLLVAQTSLASAGRVDIHRRLGSGTPDGADGPPRGDCPRGPVPCER